jgi:hypothetical protein
MRPRAIEDVDMFDFKEDNYTSFNVSIYDKKIKTKPLTMVYQREITFLFLAE